jgi:hypothetical protein
MKVDIRTLVLLGGVIVLGFLVIAVMAITDTSIFIEKTIACGPANIGETIRPYAGPILHCSGAKWLREMEP